MFMVSLIVKQFQPIVLLFNMLIIVRIYACLFAHKARIILGIQVQNFVLIAVQL